MEGVVLDVVAHARDFELVLDLGTDEKTPVVSVESNEPGLRENSGGSLLPSFFIIDDSAGVQRNIQPFLIGNHFQYFLKQRREVIQLTFTGRGTERINNIWINRA